MNSINWVIACLILTTANLLLTNLSCINYLIYELIRRISVSYQLLWSKIDSLKDANKLNSIFRMGYNQKIFSMLDSIWVLIFLIKYFLSQLRMRENRMILNCRDGGGEMDKTKWISLRETFVAVVIKKCGNDNIIAWDIWMKDHNVLLL